MTTHIIARFADGKLLVQETKAPDQVYYKNANAGNGLTSGLVGLQIRMGGIGHIDKILSVTTNFEKDGLASPLGATSSKLDMAYVRLFRRDVGLAFGTVTSGIWPFAGGYGVSGAAGAEVISGLTSGAAFGGEICNSAVVSGISMVVTVNAIGY